MGKRSGARVQCPGHQAMTGHQPIRGEYSEQPTNHSPGQQRPLPTPAGELIPLRINIQRQRVASTKLQTEWQTVQLCSIAYTMLSATNNIQYQLYCLSVCPLIQTFLKVLSLRYVA